MRLNPKKHKSARRVRSVYMTDLMGCSTAIHVIKGHPKQPSIKVSIPYSQYFCKSVAMKKINHRAPPKGF